MDKDLRISALEAQIDRLAARVDDLERALFGEEPLDRPEWTLTMSESRLFGVLANRDFVSKEAAMVALYDDGLRDRPEIKIVDVFVCKLRRKLKPFGVVIETVWGQGYRLKDRETMRRAA